MVGLFLSMWISKGARSILKLKDFFYGTFLGFALLAPGLSISTLAMILGIYEKLINGINDIFSSRWKSPLPFIIPLILGVVLALLLSSRVVTWAMRSYPFQMYFLFLGLIVGAIPLLLRTSDAKETFKGKHITFVVIFTLLVASINFLDPVDTVIEGNMSVNLAIRLMIAGALGATAMLLPGISAALMFLLMGVHGLLARAISELNLPVLGVVILGGLIGLFVSSKGIKWLLNKHTAVTYAISVGMVAGSMVVVFPGIPIGITESLTSMGAFVVGLVAVICVEIKRSRSVQ